VLLRYVRDERTLSHHDWVTLTEAVDALNVSVVVIDDQEQTFRQFYEERIDSRYADLFLAHLVTMNEVEMEGRRAQATTAQEIGRLLDAHSRIQLRRESLPAAARLLPLLVGSIRARLHL